MLVTPFLILISIKSISKFFFVHPNLSKMYPVSFPCGLLHKNIHLANNLWKFSKELDSNYWVGVLVLVLVLVFEYIVLYSYSWKSTKLLSWSSHTYIEYIFLFLVLVKKYWNTTTELEYSYSYSSTLFCTPTHEKVLNCWVGVLILISSTFFCFS